MDTPPSHSHVRVELLIPDMFLLRCYHELQAFQEIAMRGSKICVRPATVQELR